MSFFTEKELRIASDSSELEQETKSFIKESAFLADITIFLSHSHKDKNLVIGLQRYLARSGYKLYIDWQDSEMPRITNQQTAIKIKERIKELDYFFMLATNNALKSRWVPWEIGVADSVKKYDNILIIPVTDDNGNFNGNEYLQVYKCLELIKGMLDVFKPENRIFSEQSLINFFKEK